VARSYMWGPHVSLLYFYLFLFLFWGTEATISRIFQKLYIFHMILDEDDFYIKIVALDEILKLTAYKKDMIFSRR
jgi:hypothetical protein